MEQLPALLLLGLGLIIIIVFTPLAWRKAKEEAASNGNSFGQVLSEEIQALEAQLAQLRQEYRTMSHQVEAGPVKTEAVQVEQVTEGRPIKLLEEQETAPGKLPDIQLYRQVFQAYDDGKSVTEIAKELGRGKGEIELILNLRR